MKSIAYFLILCLFLAFNNLGLAQQAYIPDFSLNANTPTYKNNLNLELIFPNNSEGMKFGLAYSPIKHLSVFVGMIDMNKGSDNLLHTKGYNFTTAVGTYRISQNLNKNNNRRPHKFSFSTNIGYARGHIKTIRSEFKSEFDYHKVFAQAGVGLEYGNLNLNMLIRGTRVKYIRGFVDQGYLIPDSATLLDEILKSDHFNTMAAKFKIGYRFKFINVFFGVAMEWRPSNSSSFLNNGTPFVGLTIDLNKIRSSFFKTQSK